MKTTIVLLGTMMLLGCATSPYAIIDGTQSQVSDPDNYDVKILSVDGKRLPKEDIENVSPGFHYINLVTTKRLNTRAKDADYKMLAIDVKECTRYLVTAQHKNSVRDEWEPKVLREEPIKACTPGEKPETSEVLTVVTDADS
ncbi:hypothetical protein [Alteromonas antoniana]|uniref:hypothetical protein n=1 Tax=Alteromonas antoniana TaxID=2803813 RepID=UPI001C453803|nr:hypothetical protein [Alteromonas antoniana]